MLPGIVCLTLFKESCLGIVTWWIYVQWYSTRCEPVAACLCTPYVGLAKHD